MRRLRFAELVQDRGQTSPSKGLRGSGTGAEGAQRRPAASVHNVFKKEPARTTRIEPAGCACSSWIPHPESLGTKQVSCGIRLVGPYFSCYLGLYTSRLGGTKKRRESTSCAASVRIYFVYIVSCKSAVGAGISQNRAADLDSCLSSQRITVCRKNQPAQGH